jgi:spore germination cell wall hydrolase CwlJ-like protein
LFGKLLATLLLLNSEAAQTLETAFLAANIYHEARSEPAEGQLCVAYVTISRAQDRNPIFGGPTLRSVVFKENVREDGRLSAEFSWWERRSMPRDHEAVAAVWKLAKRARQAPLDSLCSLREARYYKNSDVAGPGGSCWFARNTVYLGSVGNHDFYRPHRSVFEWKQGTSKDCYSVQTASEMPPRIPRPRPSDTSTADQTENGRVALLE